MTGEKIKILWTVHLKIIKMANFMLYFPTNFFLNFKTQFKLPEMKTTMSEMKNTQHGINDRSDIAEGKDSECKEVMLETIPRVTQREKGTIIFKEVKQSSTSALWVSFMSV